MKSLVLAGMCLGLFAACTSSKKTSAVAWQGGFVPTSQFAGAGEVSVYEAQEGESALKILVTAKGLVPNSVHGFHIHEKADCSAADGASAGGHWNPEGRPHGGAFHSANPLSHLGDLGNLTADGNGNIRKFITLEGVSWKTGLPNDLWGRALVVHAQKDDETTQPSGNSGPRILCGALK